MGAGNDPASKITSELAEPDREWVIGFSLQLAINQHQFSLHTLGSCHLCKDDRVNGTVVFVSVFTRFRVMGAATRSAAPLFSQTLILFILLTFVYFLEC